MKLGSKEDLEKLNNMHHAKVSFMTVQDLDVRKMTDKTLKETLDTKPHFDVFKI
tara:strand:- start:1117 stop:1278 length:162 start_codon:yes stop_codon:yes gene_type:complete